MPLATWINIASAVLAFVAAGLWVRSATVKVPHKEQPDSSGMFGASISIGGVDFIATAVAQGEWNKRAAWAAAGAAVAQGAAVLVSI